MSQRHKWLNQGRYGLEQREALPLPKDLRPDEPASAALHAYWNRLRGPRRAPHRRDLHPAELGPTLSHTFVIEGGGDGKAFFRLAGSGIFELFQRELRTLDWLTLFGEQSRPRAESCARAVLGGAEVALVRLDGRTARHRVVPLEILLLPLATEPGDPPRAVGTLVACDRPYWLGAQPLTELSVRDAELFPAAAGVASGGETGGPSRPNPWRHGPIRRLRHLALYLGGRTD